MMTWRSDTRRELRSTTLGPGDLAVLVGGLVLAIVVRIGLLPMSGFRGDLDQFVLWVHGLATEPLGQAYRMNLSFPPVMVYVFAILAAIDPAFRTAADASDEAIRVLMKTPATIADLGLALGVGYALRDRPRWAAAAAMAVLLVPATFYVSAWWGQYESIYVLGGLVALVLAWHGRPYLASAALAVAVMTKPQAVPFVVPMGAWLVARYGLRHALLAGLVGIGVATVIWLPFIADDGPTRYLQNLDQYQNGIFALLSVRAWNFWNLVQEAAAGGELLSDSVAILGPMTPRILGFAVVGLLEMAIFLAVYRVPSRRNLALGLAASVLVTFAFLTTMHERYAYGALVFLAPLLPDRRILGIWVVLAAAVTANLVAAVPFEASVNATLPATGFASITCSILILCVTAACLWLLVQGEGVQRTPGGTTADSGATRRAS